MHDTVMVGERCPYSYNETSDNCSPSDGYYYPEMGIPGEDPNENQGSPSSHHSIWEGENIEVLDAGWPIQDRNKAYLQKK